ncbi:ChaN family lipoprotein [Ectothiorhodosinus mongolicus]|nr:ChaN family lipoprotein [Ectothiorhodosinus mongolicus]
MMPYFRLSAQVCCVIGLFFMTMPTLADFRLAPEGGWQAPHGQQHPLLGHVWLTAAARPVDVELWQEQLSQTQYLLLGEVHDNRDHQALHRLILLSLAHHERRASLAMEIFDLDDQPVIDELRARGPVEADAVAEAVGMSDRGWPWPFSRATVQWALDNQLPLIAANLSMSDAMQVARQGAETLLSEAQLAALKLPESWNSDREQALTEQIIDAHCGFLPPQHAGGMVMAQRVRDAIMARELMAASGQPAVLIAGNGHVRQDLGVPVYLMTHSSQASVLSIGLVEVDADKPEAMDYSALQQALYDIVIFTTRQRITDPCDDFREQLERLRQ